jgi:glycosyltransferase involved in cell wall biosynthesis
LLKSILAALDLVSIGYLFLDQRLEKSEPFFDGFAISPVRPSFGGRLRAEYALKRLVDEDDRVLVLSDQPPLSRFPGSKYLLIRDRVLLGGYDRLFGLRERCKLLLRRKMLKLLQRNVDAFIVQSYEMRRALLSTLGSEAQVMVMPLYQSVAQRTAIGNEIEEFDFVYGATTMPHKNLKNLLDAWIILAEDGLTPSLLLSIVGVGSVLSNRIEQINQKHGTNIVLVDNTDPDDLLQDYLKAGCLIYPALIEAFGRPLIEAQQLGLQVIAAELDYVREVIDPVETFDPASPVSIARAVRRYLKSPGEKTPLLPPAEFAERLGDLIAKRDAQL